MPDQTTIAKSLQAQADKTARAAEVIDKDPEAALAALDAVEAVKATDGSPVTVADMLGLFQQLVAQQTAMQTTIAQLMERDSIRQRAQVRDTQAEVAAAKKQQEDTLELWRTEPREPVFIQPDMSEEKIAAVMEGQMPPRVFLVNGLQYPVPVGTVVEVPGSVAALVRYSQNPRKRASPWDMHRMPQDIETIPRPNRGQFLAAAQEVSPGYAGKSGEGHLIPNAVATGPDSALPLDQRYDAFGR